MKFDKRSITLKSGVLMTLEEADPRDTPELLRYLVRVGRETDNLVIDENGLGFSEEQEKQYLAAMRARDDAIRLNGKIDGKIISTAQIGQKSPRPRVRHVGVLDITVAKDYWSLGVGTAVIHALFDFARGIGIEIVELDVKSTNERAIGLYKKMGFEIAGTYKKALKFKDGTYYDNYLMQAFITNK